MFDLAIMPLGEINSAHSSATQQSHQPVGSTRPWYEGWTKSNSFFHNPENGTCKSRTRGEVVPQKRYHLGANMRGEAPFGEYSLSFPLRSIREFPKYLADSRVHKTTEDTSFEVLQSAQGDLFVTALPVTREFHNQNGSYKYTCVRVIM